MRINARLLIALLTVAFAPLIEGGTTHLPVFILRMLVLALLTAHLTGSVKEGGFTFFRTPLDLGVIAVLVATAVSAFVAPYNYTALTWVQLIIYYVLFFYLVRAALALENGVQYAVITILAVSVFEAGLGIAQYLGGAWRPNGTFFNPNMLAGYVVPAVLISVSLLIFGHRWAGGALRAAAFVAVCLLGLAAVVLTGSRGGVLALAAGLFVVLWAKRKAWALVAFAAVLLAVFVVPNPVRDRIFSGETFAYSRAGIWRGAAAMMADHPQGVGLGNFKYYWSRYNFPVEGAIIRYGRSANTAHSEYLNAGAEMGFAGLAAFLLCIMLLARALYRCARAPGKDSDRPLITGLSGGITAVLTHSAVDANMHEPGIVFLFLLLVAMALNICTVQEERKVLLIEKRKKTRVAALASVFIILMSVWAALPALGFYYSNLGSRAMKGGDPAAALSYAEKAAALEPGNASHHNQAASASYSLYAGGRKVEYLQAALKELDEAERLNPVDRAYPALAAWIEYGYAAGLADPAARNVWFKSALISSRRARELDPHGWDVLFTQARADMALGATDCAASTLEELKRNEPNFLAGRFLLAEALEETGKTGDALRECYDIISADRRLGGVRMDENDRRFVAVDMGAVRRLVNSLEEGSR